MNTTSRSSSWRTWIAPEYPGLNKDLMVGMLCGLLGPLGAGLFLRSLFDFALCAVVGGLAMLVAGDGAFVGLVPSIVGAAWVAFRITWDTKRWRDGRCPGGEGAGMAETPPVDTPDRITPVLA
ncbi:MAG: hypothetical protein AB7Q00_12625 [Phycisphaerales bacterium]